MIHEYITGIIVLVPGQVEGRSGHCCEEIIKNFWSRN